MTRIETVLLATDASQASTAAEDHAVELAARLGARLLVLSVVSGTPTVRDERQLAVESIEDGEGRMFGEMDLTGTPFDDDMSHLTPRFVTADAAQQLSELEADYDNVGADLRAFDAPSECDLIAYQGWERRNAAKLAALRALCVNLKHAASPVL